MQRGSDGTRRRNKCVWWQTTTNSECGIHQERPLTYHVPVTSTGSSQTFSLVQFDHIIVDIIININDGGSRSKAAVKHLFAAVRRSLMPHQASLVEVARLENGVHGEEKRVRECEEKGSAVCQSVSNERQDAVKTTATLKHALLGDRHRRKSRLYPNKHHTPSLMHIWS